MQLHQKRISILRYFFAILVLIANFGFRTQPVPSPENQVKAVFLFNFTQFVEWPSKAFSKPQLPFVIGILGKNPFGDYLNKTILNEKVGVHPLVVKYYSSLEEVKDCQILFINFDETAKLDEALTALKGKSILTVSDANNFLKQGGIIRFFTKNDKLHFQINPEAAKAVDLTISSKLLRLAEIVVPKKK